MTAAAAIPLGAGALNADGDLNRHLRVGREILAHGLFFVDRFSWTRLGTPFVPFEWGSEVLYSLADQAAGLPGVLILMSVVIGITYFLLDRWLERLGMDPVLAFATAVAAGMAGSVHWLARPHVFSYVLVVGVMWMLDGRRTRIDERGRAEPSARLSSLVPCLLLFAVWANLHGGFLFGLVLIGLYAAGDAMEAGMGRHPLLRSANVRRGVLMLCAALAGTSLNPVGPRILSHLTGYLGKTWLINMTVEYHSPNFHTAPGRIFLVLLLISMAVVAVVRQRMPWRHLAVFLVSTAFALHSVRNVPLWALTGFPLAMLHGNDAWNQLTWKPVAWCRRVVAVGAAASLPGLFSLAVAVALTLVALTGGRIAGAQLLADRFDPNTFPVTVVARARAADVEGRMFNEFNWGGYVLNNWPEQKDFIDGQTDIYDVPLSKLYVSLRDAEPGWDRRLDSLGVSIVLLPAAAPLARWLMASEKWVVADSADGAVRFGRADLGTSSSSMR
jgi:hypothetical protein